MQALKTSFIIFLVTGSLVKSSDYAQLRLLDQVIDNIRNDRPIETIVTFWHREDRTCPLQRWNPSGIPILRSNELGTMRVRGNFNHKALAIVCLTENPVSELLDIVAGAFDTMRQERVILWTQRKPTERFLEEVSKQADTFKFTRLLVLEVADDTGGVASFYRLNAFPTPRFERISNAPRIKDMTFYTRILYFQGKELIVKPRSDAYAMRQHGTWLEDLDIIEFARRWNATLILHDEGYHADHFDIDLSQRFITSGKSYNEIDFVNPLSASSLMIVVPCSTELNFAEVVQHLDVLTWVWYLLCVYGSFVLVESVILVVTYRITGEEHRLTVWNPLLNLRALRAILGLPFPELRRASLSLRQLFLAITVFGFVFSSFFGCKLSALLTKPIKRAQVRNFEELRASGMPTVTDVALRSYIEREIDPEFFHRVVPKVLTPGHPERVKLFLSFDNRHSFLLLSTRWKYFDELQRSLGIRIYCESPDLVITERLPWVYGTQNNSIYKWPLSKFLMTIQEAGISSHWIKGIIKSFLKAYNIKSQRDRADAVPISLQHLSWLWYLLITGYGIATVAFLVEISLKSRSLRIRRSRTITDTSV